MKPYASGDGWTLYHGDCRVVLPTLTGIDAIVTDSPYGVGFEYASHDDNLPEWRALMDDVVPAMRRIAPVVVMPSCQIKQLPWWYTTHPPDWLIAWYNGSPGHQSHVGFNDWEPHLVWGKPPSAMHDFFHTRCGFDDNGHPCPKPIEWAHWLVSRVSLPGGTVLDPFCGSGTTGVACRQLGRRFVGVELDEGYCELAARRIASALNPQTYRDDRAKDSPLFMEGAA